MPDTNATRTLKAASVAIMLSISLLSGCKSKEEVALEQAKSQAAATNTPQQIQYIDANGDTVTTTVQPPVAGQPQQVTTLLASPPPGPIPHRTDPAIQPIRPTGPVSVGSNAQSAAAQSNALPSNQLAPNQQNGVGLTTSSAPSFTVPAGTELAIRINQHISVKSNRAGDHFSGEVVEPVQENGSVVIPRGAQVRGRIDEAHRRGHFKGRSLLELRLTSLTLNGTEYPLDTRDSVRTKKGKGKRTAGFIGGLTGAGMVIGGIATGGVGVAMGGAAGAGAGTLIAGATGNRDIEIPAESVVHFRLREALTIQ